MLISTDVMQLVVLVCKNDFVKSKLKQAVVVMSVMESVFKYLIVILIAVQVSCVVLKLKLADFNKGNL